MVNSSAIIILAAGSSSRLGEPKQFLEFQGKSLLENIISESQNVFQSKVLVVIGSGNNPIYKYLENLNVKIIINDNWQSGMGSSVTKGVSDLVLSNPEAEFCIITVCDQPFVTSEILQALIDEFDQKVSGIIASEYAGTLGTPVLFSKKYFQDLVNLEGSEGAKKLLGLYHNDVKSVSFELGAIDIDTREDYDKLLKKIK